METDDRLARRIKLSDLRMLAAVADTGSMSKAAALLNVTQPAVSKAISELEASLAVKLFDRGPHGVEPTLFGQSLLNRSRTILDEVRQSIKDIRFLSDTSSGELSIGFAPPLAGFLVSVIEALSSRYPNLIFNIVERDAGLISQGGLRGRRLDLVLGRIGTPADDAFETEVLFDDQICIVAGIGNALLGRRNLKLSHLLEERWVLPPMEELAGSHISEAFAAAGLRLPKTSIVANSIRIRDRLLATGKYLAVVPRSELFFGNNESPYKVLPVRLTAAPRPVGIITLRNWTAGAAVKIFIEEARRQARSVRIAG